MPKSFLTLAFAALFLLSSITNAQSTDVDPNHWGYEYLDLLASRGMVDGFYSGVRPVNRGEFSQYLLKAEEKYRKDKTLLSNTELRLLERLKGDFLSDPDSPNSVIIEEFREKHIYSWSEADSWFAADLFIDQEIELSMLDENQKEKNISKSSGGGRIRGYLSNDLYFYLWFTNTLERGGEPARTNLDPSQGLPAVAYNGNLFRDDAITYLKYRAPWFDLTIGRQNIIWGTSGRNGLTFSSNNPPMNIHFGSEN